MGRSAAKSERYVREFYTALKIASLLVALLWSPYVIGQTIIFSSCFFFFFFFLA